MYDQLKISQHKHTGRLRPHQHTSYVLLAFLVLMVGILLIAFSVSEFAEADPGPQSGSIGLSGTLPTVPPKIAATIGTPSNQQHFSTSPVTVSGSCPSGTLVEVYKNNIFAGSTPCGSNDSYSLQVDLLYGQNDLTAQVYDVLNQAGPVSSTVTIFYDASPLQSASLSLLNFSGTQLLLNTSAVYRGTFPGQALNVPITIIGGVSPFAINIEWGDSANSVISRSDNSVFNATHTYQKPGTYQITIQATDNQQQVAFLTVAAIVNGQPGVVSTSNISSISKSPTSKLLVLWPMYAIVLTLVISFWVGEQREKRVIGKSMLQQKQTIGITPHLSS